MQIGTDKLGRALRPTIPAPDRFWAKVRESDGCWEWTAHRKPNGYGCFGIDRRTTEYAHRMAYQLSVGPIPAGFEICHHCDNPGCVRPDHLFLGTRTDNMRDAKDKNRLWTGPRVDHCHRGHAYSAENTAIDPKSGKRRCRACHAARNATNRGKYDQRPYQRASYLKHRERRLAGAKARYARRKEAA